MGGYPVCLLISASTQCRWGHRVYVLVWLMIYLVQSIQIHVYMSEVLQFELPNSGCHSIWLCGSIRNGSIQDDEWWIHVAYPWRSMAIYPATFQRQRKGLHGDRPIPVVASFLPVPNCDADCDAPWLFASSWHQIMERRWHICSSRTNTLRKKISWYC